MPANYEYDVFFSYKRHDLTLHWTREVSKRIKFWLTEELGGIDAKIFVDESSIEIGDKWPDSLKQALKNSRCMVCVWSPSYFQSDWCVSEWSSFLEREKIAHMKSHGLIAPLKFHDGEHFPKEAKDVEWQDVSMYAATLAVFWNSARAIELDEKLKVFAASVAKMVNNAPPFRPDWPIVDRPGIPVPTIGLSKL